MTSTKRRETTSSGAGLRASRPQRQRRHRAVEPEDFKTSMLSVRVKDQVKADATAVLAGFGISMPEAVRVFLGRIAADRALPFPLELPNAETARALRESLATDYKHITSTGAMFDELEEGHAE